MATAPPHQRGSIICPAKLAAHLREHKHAFRARQSRAACLWACVPSHRPLPPRRRRRVRRHGALQVVGDAAAAAPNTWELRARAHHIRYTLSSRQPESVSFRCQGRRAVSVHRGDRSVRERSTLPASRDESAAPRRAARAHATCAARLAAEGDGALRIGAAAALRSRQPARLVLSRDVAAGRADAGVDSDAQARAVQPAAACGCPPRPSCTPMTSLACAAAPRRLWSRCLCPRGRRWRRSRLRRR